MSEHLAPFSDAEHLSGQCEGCRCELTVMANRLKRHLAAEIGRGDSWKEEADYLQDLLLKAKSRSDSDCKAIEELKDIAYRHKTDSDLKRETLQHIVLRTQNLVHSPPNLGGWKSVQECRELIKEIYESATAGLIETTGESDEHGENGIGEEERNQSAGEAEVG